MGKGKKKKVMAEVKEISAIDLRCEKIAENQKFHSDNISINLELRGYISFVEVGGKRILSGKYCETIEGSLDSLQQVVQGKE